MKATDFSPAQISQIENYLRGGVSEQDIAAVLGVPRSSVARILSDQRSRGEDLGMGSYLRQTDEADGEKPPLLLTKDDVDDEDNGNTV